MEARLARQAGSEALLREIVDAILGEWQPGARPQSPRLRFSVVMPVRDEAALLHESVASALAQTWRDFELIIVDDGSAEPSRELTAHLPDPAHLPLRRPPLGMAAASNGGWRGARGELVVPPRRACLLPGILSGLAHGFGIRRSGSRYGFWSANAAAASRILGTPSTGALGGIRPDRA